MTNIFAPQEPSQVSVFMESVQPSSSLFAHMRETATLLTKAVGNVVTLPVAAALAAGETTAYTAANILALPSAGLLKIGGITSAARTKLKNLFA